MKTQQKYYTPEEYLLLEEADKDKSKYIDGCIVPMGGCSTNHNQVIGNFVAQLKLAFKKLDYEVFIFQVLLWIPEKRIYTYPDVMVVAGG
jgi:Uma2 family endonuclease